MNNENQSELEQHFNAAWESEATYTRFEIALVQLRYAIDHYMQHEYLPAITLANAADGMLGPMARKVFRKNAADMRSKSRSAEVKWVRENLTPVPPEDYKELSSKDILKYLNWIPKDLKHNDNGVKDEELTRFYGRAAQELIDAAVLNVILVLGVKAPEDPIIAKYHLEYPTWNGGLPRLS